MNKNSPKFPVKSISLKKNHYLLQTRNYASLSMNIIDAINIITLDNRYPPELVGSFKYIIHEYPADIDMFSKYESCCNYNEAIKDITQKFKDIALRIKNNNDKIYLGDFKAGYDNRYKINIGFIKNNKLFNYDPVKIRNEILKLNNKHLLNEENKNELLLKVLDKPTFEEYYNLEKYIRKYYIIRWNIDEIIDGFKILNGDKKFTLEEALSSKSIVKIDIWLYLNDRFIEMTNWYLLKYKENGVLKDLSVKLDKYDQSLIKDINYYNNPIINNRMKVAKRLWLYAILFKKYDLISLLYSLFSSGAAKMYQIIGEIDTIINILSKYNETNNDLIFSNIENWKNRLGTIMTDILTSKNATYIFEKINMIIKNKNDKNLVISLLEQVSEKLNDSVNKYVYLYFKKNKIYVNKILKLYEK